MPKRVRPEGDAKLFSSLLYSFSFQLVKSWPPILNAHQVRPTCWGWSCQAHQSHVTVLSQCDGFLQMFLKAAKGEVKSEVLLINHGQTAVQIPINQEAHISFRSLSTNLRARQCTPPACTTCRPTRIVISPTLNFSRY
jgi:hypothetical protein